VYQEQYFLTIRDINYGNHMDHLALLNYLHETRVRFLRKSGYSEIDVDGLGTGLVVAELQCNYRKECFYGEEITVKMNLELLSPMKLRLNYVVTKNEGEVVANAIIRLAFLDRNKKVVVVPQWLQNLAQGENQ